jgi:hypothetical protein
MSYEIERRERKPSPEPVQDRPKQAISLADRAVTV